MGVNFRGVDVGRNLGGVSCVRTRGRVTEGNVTVFADATGRRVRDGGTAVRQQDFAAISQEEMRTVRQVADRLDAVLKILQGVSVMLLVMLGGVRAGAEVLWGDVDVDVPMLLAAGETNFTAGVSAAKVAELVLPVGVVASNALELAGAWPAVSNVVTAGAAAGATALQAEADTLQTVTARGATTTNAITIGTRDVLSIEGVASLAQGSGVIASGVGSRAGGLESTASGDFSDAWGAQTTASGGYSRTKGFQTTASGLFSEASGARATASHNESFAWQGSTPVENLGTYTSHGAGTYNINPVGGTGGFWIGETTLGALLDEKPTFSAATNIAETVVDAANLMRDTGEDATDNFLHASFSAGRLWGGEITANGAPGKIDIAAGEGITKDGAGGWDNIPTDETDGQAGQLGFVAWDAVVGLDLAGVGYNLVYWDASATNFAVSLDTTFYADFDFVTDFTIGRMYYDGTESTIRLCGMNMWNFPRRAQMFGEERFPVERAKGLLGSATALQYAVTDGVIWAEMVNRFEVDGKTLAENFRYWYTTNAAYNAWTYATTDVIDAANFNGVAGLTGMNVNRWRCDYVYAVHDGSHHVVIGRAQFNSAANAQAAAIRIPPGLLSAYATLIGRITVQEGEATMTFDNATPDSVFAAYAVPDHNGLEGLQGGGSDEYYHLTAAERDNVIALPDPYQPWTATITPADGTSTVVRASGSLPVLTLTAPTVLSVPTTDWPTNGVSRFTLTLWAGTNSVTMLTNTVTYTSTPLVSTNDWTTILYRRVGSGNWKGVGL